ncbi:hypothetical protein BDW59DRAFT_167352 [Aspergillus cavernicola]|uniref:Uncharacterized protein n=1 Tax=Aspergillus cavernicola TaxID=176166 RepID=A0ABR4HEK0_9EURO
MYIIQLTMPFGSTDYGSRNPNPSYDCDASRILDGPGTTACSADQIWCKNWLYVDIQFYHGLSRLGRHFLF